MTSAEENPELSAPGDAMTAPGADNSGIEPAKPADPLGVIAIVSGCIGLVTFGFVLAILTAVLATAAGQQAVKQRRSLENAYIAFGLAALDAVVFLVLHYLFKLPAFAG
jgi:hypothetical protein